MGGVGYAILSPVYIVMYAVLQNWELKWWSELFCFHSSLPSFDKETKESVDKDIESARKWIKEYL